ncbi:hypothetical protein HY78_15545 [Rhizorhabdus wittichii DC-6]|nr:hypothetical protein HY78_15545 [Rhizorhabdus wittichii DC-6]
MARRGSPAGSMAAIRYDMPIAFGPSLMPDRSEVRDAEVVALSFETTVDGAAALLPPGMVPAERPGFSVTRITYPSVEYLGGRGYCEVVLAVAARFRAADGDIVAGYAPVMWVDRVGALIAGREFMGFAKLPAELPPIEAVGDARRFEGREEGAPLFEGTASGLVPLSADKLERVNAGASEVVTMGWKHIPSAEGSPDADYPLANVTRWTYRQGWTGDSAIVFHRPDDRAAPFSSRVVAGLARLPIVRPRSAFVAVGDVIIDRAATRRLVGA